VRGALKKGLLTEAEIDNALKGNFRVMIRLGLLDPPAMVPYSSIGREPQDPWLAEKHKSVAGYSTRRDQNGDTGIKSSRASLLECVTAKVCGRKRRGPTNDRQFFRGYQTKENHKGGAITRWAPSEIKGSQ
jgi:hypothetical protein